MVSDHPLASNHITMICVHACTRPNPFHGLNGAQGNSAGWELLSTLLCTLTHTDAHMQVTVHLAELGNDVQCKHIIVMRLGTDIPETRAAKHKIHNLQHSLKLVQYISQHYCIYSISNLYPTRRDYEDHYRGEDIRWYCNLPFGFIS